MSASEIERTLVRLVHEIIEKNDGAADVEHRVVRRSGRGRRVDDQRVRRERELVGAASLRSGRGLRREPREAQGSAAVAGGRERR